MRTVLIDTKQLKRFEDDPEMTMDLQVRVGPIQENDAEFYRLNANRNCSTAWPSHMQTRQSFVSLGWEGEGMHAILSFSLMLVCSMAKYHQQSNNWSEVAMCVLHAAAIVSEHLFKDTASSELVISGSYFEHHD